MVDAIMEDVPDLPVLLKASAEFASYPGQHSDASVKEFLDRFPLPLIFSALSLKSDVPGLESSLVSCLEMIFGTKYGISHVPEYMPFVCVGLSAQSQAVRCLACKAVANFLENDCTDGKAAELANSHGAYPLLIDCLLHGDERVSASSIKAIINLSKTAPGIGVIFPTDGDDPTHLKNVVEHSSSSARIRVFSLIAKLFSTSAAASAIHSSGLLDLLVAEVKNSNDVLMTLSTLEVLYEVASSPHGTQYLLKTTLLQLLTSLIRNSAESVLRSRAIMICGRLLSSDDMFTIIGESTPIVSGIGDALSAINGILENLESEDSDECSSAIDSLGQIGASSEGAELLFSSSLPMVKHVIEAAFRRKDRSKQLAALHALGNIVGEGRPADRKLLSDPSEERLRQLIYETVSSSSKLTPSGLLLSVLQQDPEIRLAAYRVITGLVVRSWCLLEVCLKHEIIDIITDAYSETTKYGMEVRHECCLAIANALATQRDLDEPSLSGVASKEAVRRGPYHGKKRAEAQPVVVPAERF
ncbi:uncharacterized protein LOC116260893 isoform X2 [Nymphaea colorata]|uniref:uncharacterized protein LOC116260893 isoform X2 n=1 Tax=Nymphaea colorata TaxID=210225 RepID=UPI00214E81A1|nr:uncharacterized protein LOC116260893 isoform X2 [Nymphaea colorata]